MTIIILLKTLGFYYLTVSFLMLIRKGTLDLIKQSYSISRLFNQGIISLLFSILLLVLYHDFIWDRTVIITIIGCLGLIKSTILILYPDYIINRLNNMTIQLFRIRLFISFLVGILLLYAAFK